MEKIRKFLNLVIVFGYLISLSSTNPTEQIFGGLILGFVLIIINVDKIGKFFGWISRLIRNIGKKED